MKRVDGGIQPVLAAGVLVLVLAVGNPAAAQSGLIGYWPFDGSGADLSAAGRNLNLAGGVGFAPGLFGQALDLHGNVSQFAVRPTDDPEYDFAGSDFTLQLWVNFNGDALREQTLLEKFSGCCGPGWTMTSLAGGSQEFYAMPAIALDSAPLPVPSGVWHHVLVRRNGTLFQLFYDGIVVAAGASAGFVPDTSAPLLVGKRNDLDGRNFAVDGRIDEVAIWSRALSDGEVAFLFNGGQGNSASSLINCPDWAAEVGTWGPGGAPCGDLTSTATSTTYESESFFDVFTDFTYQATLTATRPNQPSAANTVFLRGAPTPLQTSAQRWNTGYAFNYTTNGKFSIFRYNGGAMTTIQSWVAPVGTSINGSGSPNTLKVIANGGTLTFFINGVAVKAISGETLLSGKVGVGMVRSIPTTGPGPNDKLEVVSATVGLVEPGFGPRGTGERKDVSLLQQKANETANRKNPNPDPLFDGGVRGSK